MKRRVMISLMLAGSLPVVAASGGPLAPPPGAISPTGKPLTEVEPRIAINAVNTPGDSTTLFKISQPGSYYLTGELVGVAGKRGIRIDADDVTIDFNGFTLRGPGTGIGLVDRESEEAPSIKNLTLRNGTVVGWGSGLDMFNCSGLHLEYMHFASNTSAGVSFNGSLVATTCSFAGNGYAGLENQGFSMVSNCLAAANGAGFSVSDGLIENCVSTNNEHGYLVYQAVVRESVARGNTDTGIQINSRASAVDCRVIGGGVGVDVIGHSAAVEECHIVGVSGHGIIVGQHNARVVGNSINFCGSSSGHSAIHVSNGVQRAHIEGNSSWDCYRGILVEGTQCMIIGNRVGRLRGPYNTYYAVPGNVVGPIVTPGTNAGTVSIVAGSSNYAGTFTATDPHTNISY